MIWLAPVAATVLCGLATPLAAQSMPGMDMKGMDMKGMDMKGMDMKGMTMPGMPPAPYTPKGMPSKAATKRPVKRPATPVKAIPGLERPPAGPSVAPSGEQSGMPGMDHGAMAGMDMSGAPDSHPVTMAAPSGTDLPAGHAPAPAMPADHYADRIFAAGEMAQARSAMMRDSGGQTVHQLLFNLAELQTLQGRGGYRWNGEGFIGGDVDRLWLKSEGEGTFHQGVNSAEVQALFSHAIGPYYNLQIGVRQDIRPKPGRTYATVGVEGLSPYAFEAEGALFLSDKGDLLGRLEAWHDARITQRLVLQPRIELNLSAQDVAADRYGAGLVDAELGLRLRYEVRRALAPYLGVSWERKTGRTADYARADGQGPGQVSFVTGLRSWF